MATVLAGPLSVTGVTNGFRGVLFDSGDTLIRPVGGRWNPRHDFEEIVRRRLPELAVDAFPQALAAGQKVLDAGPTTPQPGRVPPGNPGRAGCPPAPSELLWELEQPGARPLVEPFPEVPGVLEQLRAAGVGMAVVSDSTHRRPLDRHARGPAPHDRHVSRVNS
jgi:hypothetical protein